MRVDPAQPVSVQGSGLGSSQVLASEYQKFLVAARLDIGVPKDGKPKYAYRISFCDVAYSIDVTPIVTGTVCV